MKKTPKNSLNKEQKPSHRREVVVRHASKALRPPEAGRTSGVAGEGNETLDGSCGRRLLIVSFLSPHVVVVHLVYKHHKGIFLCSR
jgi:hypothetical protein